MESNNNCVYSQLKTALALREDAENLTNLYGATLYRQMIWPRVTRHIRPAYDEEIIGLRALLARGDLAFIIGPLESFIVAGGPTAVTLMEALRDV